MEFKVGDVVECLRSERSKESSFLRIQEGRSGKITGFERQDCELAHITGLGYIWPTSALKLIRRAEEPERAVPWFAFGEIIEVIDDDPCGIVRKGHKYKAVQMKQEYGVTYVEFEDAGGTRRWWDASKFKHVQPEPKKEENPASILTEAAKIAGVDRSEAYGHPLDNHRRIAGLWQAYLDARKPGALTPQDAARMMILLKIARDLHAPKRDNRVDICGYAQCLEMIEERASNE